MAQASVIVITHQELGIYVGSCLGLGFWSLLDTAGQPAVATFLDEEEAREHVASWEELNDPASYGYVEVFTAGSHATVDELAEAGLGCLLGDMPGNVEVIRHGSQSDATA